MLANEIMENFYDSKSKSLKPWGSTAIATLDELNHSINNDSERNEHCNLFENLLNEINQGIITVSPSTVDQIKAKVNEP